MENIPKWVWLAAGGVALIVVLVFLGILPGRKAKEPPPAALEFWGIRDDEQVWNKVLEKFSETNPNIKVNYQRFEEGDYEEELLNALAEGRGPDIFVLRNSQIVKHRDKIFPLPYTYFGFSTKDFQKAFVEVAAADLISSTGDILGLPLFVDTPALFYNKDIFNAAGIAYMPETWEEVLAISQRLTKRTASGGIQRAGLALGTFSNVNNAFEILNSLIMQTGNKIVDPQTGRADLETGAASALNFYASFADPKHANFSWQEEWPSSLEAFSQEEAAMVVGLQPDLARLRLKNPHLNIGVLPLPQFAASHNPIVYGAYFFPAISRNTRSPEAAWTFVLFSTAGQGNEIYLEESRRPASRRDLIARGAAKDEDDIFWRQSLIAKSWPVPDEKSIKRVFKDVIDGLLAKEYDANQAADRLRIQIEAFLP